MVESRCRLVMGRFPDALHDIRRSEVGRVPPEDDVSSRAELFAVGVPVSSRNTTGRFDSAA